MSKQKSINGLLNEISVYEGTIVISPTTSNEYISYHEKINITKYDYEKTLA